MGGNGKAEMEKSEWNWNRVSAIIEEIKHRESCIGYCHLKQY